MSTTSDATTTAAVSWPQRLLYVVASTLVRTFCRLFWRVTVEGREHVPSSGAFVLAPVHRSNIDTPLMATVTSRPLRFMGKASMWKLEAIGWLFTALGSFPVNRGTADREALRRCMEVLSAGEVLVVFPEGTRQSGPLVQPLFEGAAYVASRARVPIVPVGIGGSERAMAKGSKLIRPVKVHIVVGETIPPPAGEERASRREIHDLTERLHGELQRLFDRAQASVP